MGGWGGGGGVGGGGLTKKGGGGGGGGVGEEGINIKRCKGESGIKIVWLM